MSQPLNPLQPHDVWMRRALDMAIAAYDQGEVPVGAVLVHFPTGKIVAKSGNLCEEKHDPTLHAEVNVIRAVIKLLSVMRV